MSYKLDVELSEELEPYRSEIEATIKPYIKIELTDNSSPTWWQSKFGGLPYMPKSFEYPKSNDGEYLYLLAQINFAEVPKLEGLPEKGILQFYVANEDLLGLRFENRIKQDKFRVVYFNNFDLQEQNLITDFSFLFCEQELYSSSSKDYYLPIYSDECSGIQFNLCYAPISIEDGICSILESRGITENHNYEEEYSQLLTKYCKLFNSKEHKLLGYPYFNQHDPRKYIKNGNEYILLLQIDSIHIDINSNKNDFTLDWSGRGGGIGNFFIKRSHLEELDFSQILYNWDCS